MRVYAICTSLLHWSQNGWSPLFFLLLFPTAWRPCQPTTFSACHSPSCHLPSVRTRAHKAVGWIACTCGPSKTEPCRTKSCISIWIGELLQHAEVLTQCKEARELGRREEYPPKLSGVLDEFDWSLIKVEDALPPLQQCRTGSGQCSALQRLLKCA